MVVAALVLMSLILLFTMPRGRSLLNFLLRVDLMKISILVVEVQCFKVYIHIVLDKGGILL